MWMLIIVALLASNANAVACGSGCFEYQGSCACDQRPAVEPEAYAQPSDEKPPRSGMPSWQDPSVKVDDPKSLIYQDAKADQDRVQAETEGKRAAGIQ